MPVFGTADVPVQPDSADQFAVRNQSQRAVSAVTRGRGLTDARA